MEKGQGRESSSPLNKARELRGAPWGQVLAVPGQEELSQPSRRPVMEMSSRGVRGWGWGGMG